MAYDEQLAQRLRALAAKRRDFHEQKMFGGLGLLLRGNMCVGIWKTDLILRLGPQAGAKALEQKDVVPFDITGRPMKGWVMVKPASFKTDAALKKWMDQAIAFVSQLPRK